MLIITIYKMSNASGCYLVTKSHQYKEGSQSQKLRTLAGSHERLVHLLIGLIPGFALMKQPTSNQHISFATQISFSALGG